MRTQESYKQRCPRDNIKLTDALDSQTILLPLSVFDYSRAVCLDVWMCVGFFHVCVCVCVCVCECVWSVHIEYAARPMCVCVCVCVCVDCTQSMQHGSRL